jgi:hypothetical protein
MQCIKIFVILIVSYKIHRSMIAIVVRNLYCCRRIVYFNERARLLSSSSYCTKHRSMAIVVSLPRRIVCNIDVIVVDYARDGEEDGTITNTTNRNNSFL